MAAESIKDLCRTCIDSSDSYIRIFDEVVPDNIPLYCIINDLCQLSIRAKDGFPEYICKDCFVKISEFVIFKRKCHDAETNFISMSKSSSEEGARCHGSKETDGDAIIRGKEVDIATDIIKKQMDSDSVRDAEGVIEEIITMPFEVTYGGILVIDNLSNELSKKATENQKGRRGSHMGSTGKRKSNRRKSEDGGESEGVQISKKMREVYSGDVLEKNPKISSVAQAYYKYILEKEKHSSAKSGLEKNDEVSTPNRTAIGSGVDDSSADVPSKETPSDGNETHAQDNVVEDLLREDSEQDLDNKSAVEINNTTLNIVEVMNPETKISDARPSTEGVIEGIKNSPVSEIEGNIEIVFELSDDEVANDDGQSNCSDLEHSSTAGDDIIVVSDPQIITAYNLSDGVIVVDSEEEEEVVCSEVVNPSSGANNVPVELNPMESSDKNKENTVKKGGKDESKDAVKLIKVLASEGIQNGRNYAEELVKSNFNEKKVQVCDIGPLGNVFHVEPTVVKLNDIHKLCHPDTRIFKSVLRTPTLSSEPTLESRDESVEASTKTEEGVDVNEKECSVRKSGIVGGRIISTMKLRSKKVVGKTVGRMLCEQRTNGIATQKMTNQLTGKRGRGNPPSPPKNAITDGISETVCGGMSPAGGSSGGGTYDDVLTTMDVSESSVPPVIRTKKNCLPPKKRPVQYSPTDVPSGSDSHSIEQTSKMLDLSKSQIITKDSCVPSPSKEVSPEAQECGLKSLPLRVQNCTKVMSSVCSGVLEIDTVGSEIQLDDEEDITGTLLLTPATDKNSQAPPVAIILRKLVKDEKVDKESSAAKKSSKDSITTKLMYSCEFCDATFNKKAYMERHERDVHPEKVREIFDCTICGGEFMSKVGLNRHAKQHDSVDSSKKTPELPDVVSVKRDRNRPHVCLKCGVTVQGKLALTIHNTEVHLKEPVYPCTYCKYKFLKKERKDLHEKQCGCRRLPCVHCNKLIMAASLSQHLFTHTGQKPFLCSVCGTRFSQKGDLGRHVKQFHMGQVPPRDYLCSYCPKAFAVRSKLIIHERSHTGEKPYSCGDCGRSFAHSQSLRKHQENRELSCLPVIEQASKPYVCLICKKGWDAKYHLDKHVAWVHQMKRPDRTFGCDLCLKKYYCRSQLAYHMRTHTNEKPFACKHCDCRYMYSGMLRVHMRKDHPDIPIN